VPPLPTIARAYELAGVEPKFQKINGRDQKAYILSVNINCRHMSAGQRAMAMAMIYPIAPGVRGKKDAALKVAASATLSQRRLQEARKVLKDSRTVALESEQFGQPHLETHQRPLLRLCSISEPRLERVTVAREGGRAINFSPSPSAVF
jgi:hypothetical protein